MITHVQAHAIVKLNLSIIDVRINLHSSDKEVTNTENPVYDSVSGMYPDTIIITAMYTCMTYCDVINWHMYFNKGKGEFYCYYIYYIIILCNHWW